MERRQCDDGKPFQSPARRAMQNFDNRSPLREQAIVQEDHSSKTVCAFREAHSVGRVFESNTPIRRYLASRPHRLCLKSALPDTVFSLFPIRVSSDGAPVPALACQSHKATYSS